LLFDRVEEFLYELTNVSIYYKTPTILLDNIAAIIFQKTINLLCQDKCLQLPQKDTLGLSLARFNMHNIYTAYKRVLVHWTVRDAEQQDRTSVYF